jgi:hypothetical protein
MKAKFLHPVIVRTVNPRLGGAPCDMSFIIETEVEIDELSEVDLEPAFQLARATGTDAVGRHADMFFMEGADLGKHYYASAARLTEMFHGNPTSALARIARGRGMAFKHYIAEYSKAYAPHTDLLRTRSEVPLLPRPKLVAQSRLPGWDDISNYAYSTPLRDPATLGSAVEEAVEVWRAHARAFCANVILVGGKVHTRRAEPLLKVGPDGAISVSGMRCYREFVDEPETRWSTLLQATESEFSDSHMFAIASSDEASALSDDIRDRNAEALASVSMSPLTTPEQVVDLELCRFGKVGVNLGGIVAEHLSQVRCVLSNAPDKPDVPVKQAVADLEAASLAMEFDGGDRKDVEQAIGGLIEAFGAVKREDYRHNLHIPAHMADFNLAIATFRKRSDTRPISINTFGL